jgi:predicted RNA-binding Zn ribbon-like protein
MGGRLCLAFVDTVRWHLGQHPQECLTSYADLLAWCQRAQLLDEAQVQSLLAAAAARPDLAGAVLQQAISFREALYHVLLATVAQRPPDQVDLETVNAVRAQALSHSEIEFTSAGFAWRWAAPGQELGWMLWPLVRSAEELLLSPDLKLVKVCAGPDCGWLFLDSSQKRARRWCAMEVCGNRAKARRHYQRTRKHTQASTDQAADPRA